MPPNYFSKHPNIYWSYSSAIESLIPEFPQWNQPICDAYTDVEDANYDPVAIYMSKIKDKAEEEKIYYETIYFQDRTHEEKDLFITEATNLRRLFVARKEFILPIQGLLTPAEFSETYKHLLDFIDFQEQKFILLNPKR